MTNPLSIPLLAFAPLLAIGVILPGARARDNAAPSPSLLLIANKADRTLSLIDPATATEVAVVAENAITGHEVAASPDGHFAYVPIYGDSGVGRPGLDGSTLLVIDLRARGIIHTVDFGHGVRPHCARYDSHSGMLYVTTELDNAVTIIDPKTLQIVGKVPTGQPESHMLVLTRDGRRGYTANVGPGSVSVLDMKARRTIAVIPVTTHVQRIAISNDDRRVFTSDTIRPRLAVVDTGAGRVATWVALPGKGYGAAPTADGRSLLVAIPAEGKMALVDLATLRVTRTIGLPGSPQEVLVRPDGKVAYVSCATNRKVAAVDLSTWTLSGLIEAGESTDGLAWAGP